MKFTGLYIRTGISLALALLVAPLAGVGCEGCNPPPPVEDAGPPPDEGVAALSISDLAHDFGSATVGTAGSSFSFTITNAGDGVSGTIESSVAGADFAVSDTCTTLDPGGTCTVNVTFNPTATGARTGSLTVSSNPGGSLTADLTGTGTGVGELSIAPGNHTFPGAVILGQAAAVDASFTITNPSDGDTGTLTTSLVGANPGDYTIVSDDCDGSALAGAATCTITVSFSPADEGSRQATLSVSASPGGTVTGSLSGTGIRDAAILADNTLLSFGTVITGTSSGDLTVNVANVGGLATSALTQTLGGADAGQFEIRPGSNCNAVLAPAANCSVLVRFNPTVVGDAAATLTIAGTTGGTVVVTLIGTGNAIGDLQFNPSTFAFAATTVDTLSLSTTIELENTGGTVTGAIAVSLAGLDPDQFTLVAGGNLCQGVALQPAAICTISVQFAPTGAGGTRNATLVAQPVGGATATASLSGLAVPAAEITIDPTSFDFGSTGTDRVTTAQTFTIRNVGGQATGVPDVSLGGANASQFVLNDTACNAALAPAGTCDVTVSFAPNTTGAKVASLDVVASPGGSFSANVFGIGTDPANMQPNVGNLDFSPGGVATGPAVFEFTTIGETRALTFTLSNGATSEPTGNIVVTSTGVAAADYTTTDNCTTLPAGQTCTVTVTYAPSAVGVRAASIVATASPGGTATVAVTGDARTRLEIIDPALPVNFGSTNFGDGSTRTDTITVRNNLATAQTITRVLAPASDYTFGASMNNNCNGVVLAAFDGIGAADECTANVIFTPSALGTRAGTYTVTAGANSVVAALTGIGLDSLQVTNDGDDDDNNVATVDAVGNDGTGNFFNVARNTAGFLTITLTNTSATANTSSLVTVLSGSRYAVTSDGCAGNVLIPSGTCDIDLTFLPNANGVATGTIAVSGAVGGTATLDLTGTGVDPANLVLSAATIAYGNVFGGATAVQSVTVTNDGAVAAGVLGITDPGDDFLRVGGGAADALIAGDCGFNAATQVLQPGTSCTLRVRFTPTGTFVAKTGTMTLNASPGASNLVLSFTGTKISTLAVTAPVYDTVVIPGNQTATWTVSNLSAASVSVTNASLGAAGGLLVGEGDFAVINNGCLVALTAAGTGAGSSCGIQVRFTPSATGVRAVRLTVNDLPGTTAEASAVGQGVGQTAADIEFVDTVAALGTVDVGATVVGEVGASRTFLLRNNGEQASTVPTIAVSNTEFDVVNGCTAALIQNATCSITVTFSPTGTAGARTFALTATATTGGTAEPIDFEANALAAGSLAVLLADQTFASTILGGTSAVVTMQVQNTSNATVTPTAIAASASNTSQVSTTQYSVAAGATLGGSCFTGGTAANGPVAIGAGGACTVNVVFTPNAVTAGAEVVRFLTVTYPVGQVSYATLRGVPLDPANIATVATGTNFGSIAINTTKTATVTLTNNGDVASGTIVLSALAGNDSGQFSKTACLIGGVAQTTLAPDAVCTITVTFAPTTTGAKVANFTASAAPGLGSTVFNLDGTGLNVAALSMSPSAAIVGLSGAVNSNGTIQAFRITNNAGTADSGPVLFSIDQTTDFTVLNGSVAPAGGVGVGGQCNANVLNGTVLPAGQFCDIVVQFTPKTLANGLTTTLTVTANPGTAGAGLVNTMTGNGTSQLTVNPTTLAFGNVALGSQSSLTLTFTNDGAVATGTLFTELAGANANNFSVTNDNCVGQVLAASNIGTTDECTVAVEFVPQGTAGTAGVVNRTATVTVSGTPGNSATSNLTGTAVAAP